MVLASTPTLRTKRFPAGLVKALTTISKAPQKDFGEPIGSAINPANKLTKELHQLGILSNEQQKRLINLLNLAVKWKTIDRAASHPLGQIEHVIGNRGWCDAAQFVREQSPKLFPKESAPGRETYALVEQAQRKMDLASQNECMEVFTKAVQASILKLSKPDSA